MAHIHRFGESTFSRINTQAGYTHLLKDNLPNSDPLIVKADWVGINEGSARTLEALRCILDAAQGKVIVTEGHLLWRPRELEPKGKFFLEKYGYTDFFKDNGVEYVNATDEVWARRTADERVVRKAVESRFPPVSIDKLYCIVPEKLFRYRGSSLVSLSKRKEYQSFTMKNLFGLIPDPVRAWWHGLKDTKLAKSILDINKVYGALFELVGVFDAPRGDGSNPFTRDLAVSKSLAQLDAVLNHVARFDPEKAPYISMGNHLFGSFDDELLKKAESSLDGWFPAIKKNL
jgi:uncharacterized protein (DUF362 family)